MPAAMAATGGRITLTMGVFTGMTRWMKMVKRDTAAMRAARGRVVRSAKKVLAIQVAAPVCQRDAEGVGSAHEEEDVPANLVFVALPLYEAHARQGKEHAANTEAVGRGRWCRPVVNHSSA